jgi:hypothetical protein
MIGFCLGSITISLIWIAIKVTHIANTLKDKIESEIE